MSRERQAPSHELVALAGLVVAMLAACLWPFDFTPRNGVSWLHGGPGIRFSGLGIVAATESFPALSELSESGSITVEIAVRPSWIAKRSVLHILSFCPEEGPPALAIAAWRESLVVRVGRPDHLPGGRKYREIGVASAFKAGRTALIAVVAGPAGTSVYLDGRLAAAAPEARLAGGDAPLGRLLLAASPAGGASWQGDFRELTIHGRALSGEEVRLARDRTSGRDEAPSSPDRTVVARYPLDEASGKLIHNAAAPRYRLAIPDTFRPFRRAILSPPVRTARGVLFKPLDVALNILGFLPFGFLAAWCLIPRTGSSPRLRTGAAVLGGFALSLTIELVQAFIPARTSSLTDLVTNTAGAALGAVSFMIASRLSSRLGAPTARRG